MEHSLPGTPYDDDAPGLHEAAQQSMKGPPILLTLEQAEVLRDQLNETAWHRGWTILAGAILTNHMHLVVGAPGDPGPKKMLSDLKAWGSRALNARWGKPPSERWWTWNGSKRKLRDQAAVAAAVRYVLKQTEPLCVWQASGGPSGPRVTVDEASGGPSGPRAVAVGDEASGGPSGPLAVAVGDEASGGPSGPRAVAVSDAVRLLTPGPTPVPEEVARELARPAFYHRSATYRQLLLRATAGLQAVFRTRNPVLTLTASGTGGMEAALASCLPPGARALCLVSGRWGERWRNIARALGIEALCVTSEPGDPVTPEQLAEALDRHPGVDAVCATLCETATGVKNDIEAYGRIVAGTGALLLVDAISGLGCVPCHTDAWGVDLCVAGSQKALMLPPGLAFVSVSPKAWDRIEANSNPRAFYFDLRKYRASLATGDSPFTPATYLVRALVKSLERIEAEGVEAVWARCAHLARMARAGVEAMGLRLFARAPAEGMTVAHVPEGIEGKALLSMLEERHGIKLADGQDSLKGRIFRLAHMGAIGAEDVLDALSALEQSLTELGHVVTPGAGVEAARKAGAVN